MSDAPSTFPNDRPEGRAGDAASEVTARDAAPADAAASDAVLSDAVLSDAELSDAELSRAVAEEAGRLLLDLRESYGPLDPEDRATAHRLRKAADAASHDLIAARLAAQRPGDAILSEEGADDPARLDAERVWIVDPLDGTWEYGQGRVDFAVHVVLWVRDPASGTRGRLEAGTVALPAQGLTRSVLDPVLDLGPLPADRPLRIVASRSRPPATLAITVAALAADLASSGVTAQGVEVVDVGSVGAKVNEILSGRAEAYVHDTGFYEWDVAAPYAVAHRQGLMASHLSGTPVSFNRVPPYVADLMVARPDIAAALRRALTGAATA